MFSAARRMRLLRSMSAFLSCLGFLLGETASADIAIDAVRLMLKLIHFKNDKGLFYFPYTLNEYMCNL